jgi:hypothetical protein
MHDLEEVFCSRVIARDSWAQSGVDGASRSTEPAMPDSLPIFAKVAHSFIGSSVDSIHCSKRRLEHW